MPASLKLGVRAEAMRRAWPVAPVVVVVPDEVSYLRAVGGWSLRARYPVLIDDGTLLAHEDIARFVRGFRPERVVRWSAADAAPAAGEAAAWPAEPEKRRELITGVQFRVWGELAPQLTPTTDLQLIELWKGKGIAPPGVVVADETDPAWTAALALAVGRGEPLVWVKGERDVNAAMTPEKFGALAGAVEAGTERLGIPWRDQGDVIEAVTLCLNCPAKVQADVSSVLATTDLLGRLPDEGAKDQSRYRGKRWAWAGQVLGTPAQAAYRAMSALFIYPRGAWIFDGYPDSKPWSIFDGSAAAEPFRKLKMPVTLEDSPKNGERQWRLTTSGGLDAGLVLVNTKGMTQDFDLQPGQCHSGEVPFLNVPAAVHFVHSFSAASPGARETVAGRWLERGAYAYLGSVQEPLLQAFVPTPAVAARLLAPCAWGAAVRMDSGPAWKLAVFGDPLITVGPAPAKAAATIPLMGGRDVAELARAAVGSRDYAAALRELTLCGRDLDAAKLASAALKEDEKAVTAEAAREMVMPLHRAHDAESLVRAYTRLAPKDAANPVLRDALWQACYPLMSTTTDAGMVGELEHNLREDQATSDAGDLAPAMARVSGRDAAETMLNTLKSRYPGPPDQARLEEAIKRLRSAGLRR